MKCKNGAYKCDHCGKFTAKAALKFITHYGYRYDVCCFCKKLLQRGK